MRKKKWWILAVLCLLFTIGMTGCKKDNVGAEEDNAIVAETEEKVSYVVGFSCPDLSNPYYNTLKKVIAKQLKEEGHTLLVKNPENNSDTQTEQLQWMVENGVQAVILAPVDREKIAPALEILQEAKVKIVNVGSQVQDLSQVDSYIGVDNQEAGKLCGNQLIANLPQGGTVLLLEQTEINAINERILGFELAISGHGFVVAERLQVKSEEKASYRQVKKFLKEQKVDAIMCGDDQMAAGALKAVQELKCKTTIYSTEGSPTMKQELAKNNSPVVATVGQSLSDMGRNAVQVAVLLLEGEKVEEQILEEPFLIDRETISIYGTDGWN